MCIPKANCSWCKYRFRKAQHHLIDRILTSGWNSETRANPSDNCIWKIFSIRIIQRIRNYSIVAYNQFTTVPKATRKIHTRGSILTSTWSPRQMIALIDVCCALWTLKTSILFLLIFSFQPLPILILHIENSNLTSHSGGQWHWKVS